MVVIRLEGNEKEIYLKNLLMATEFLIKSIKDDNTLRKKSEWDGIVYNEIIKILEQINQLFYLLQRTTDEEDYKNNFGIYSDIVLSNGGLPEFFSYRQLLDDKINVEEKIKQILQTEGINSKEDLVKIWIDKANNILEDKEYRYKYLLETVPDKYQAIDFYEKIKDRQILDIRNPMDRSNARFIGNNNKEMYILSWFNYMTGFGVWNIYVAQIEEKDPERKGLLNHIFDKDNIPKSGLFDVEEKGIRVEQDYKKFLENHMTSGCFFLAREMDKTFPTIYPQRITMFQFGPNIVKGISSSSLDLSWLFLENPNAYFLTAIREDIEGSDKNENSKKSGKNDKKEDDIDNMIGTKRSWKADKLVEQRFGICSKELEKALKEYIKFSDMRFYVV